MDFFWARFFANPAEWMKIKTHAGFRGGHGFEVKTLDCYPFHFSPESSFCGYRKNSCSTNFLSAKPRSPLQELSR